MDRPPRQLPGWDGIGDRITSLTLRTGCWLFMRETKNHANNFALYLQPGDLYTLVRSNIARAVFWALTNLIALRLEHDIIIIIIIFWRGGNQPHTDADR